MSGIKLILLTSIEENDYYETLKTIYNEAYIEFV